MDTKTLIHDLKQIKRAIYIGATDTMFISPGDVSDETIVERIDGMLLGLGCSEEELAMDDMEIEEFLSTHDVDYDIQR